MSGKVYATAADAVADVADGASIMVGGFAVPQGWPSDLVLAIHERGVKNLTAICNTLGFGPVAPQIWAENRQISRLIASFGGFAGRSTAAEEQIGAGEMEFEAVPQGILAERMRAGGAGIGAFYTRVGLGTVVDDGKPHTVIDGVEYMREKALRADYAFIRAHKADTAGNLIYRRGARNFNPLMATAADVTIAQVDEIVEAGELDPEAIVTPGIFVHRIVQTKLRIDVAQLLEMMKFLGRAPGGDEQRGHALPGISRDLMALRVARELAPGDYVNLGVGMPTMVSNYIDPSVVLHAENGVLAYGSFVEEGKEDIDLYNAGGQLVTMLPGAAFFHSADSFAMARGGHLDAVVLGGFQVSEKGDLANWKTPKMGAGGIGGAMDLVAGCKKVIVLMEHVTREGEPKILRECTYPLTGGRCVTTVVTDLAVIDVTPEGLALREVAPGVTPEQVQSLTEPPLLTRAVREMSFG